LGIAIIVSAGCGDAEDEPKKVNEPCQANADCADNICHGKICASATPKENGEACQGNGDCKSFNCASAKCAAGTAAKDAECLADDECLTENCDSGKCGLKKEGADCVKDGDCDSGVCYSKKCAKACTKTEDCGKKQDCGSDDGKRLFCYDRKYDKWIGRLCGIDGKCPITTKCYGITGAAESYCTDQCKTDMECPSRYYCAEATKDKKLYCLKRGFCSDCLHDDQCPEGGKCVSHNGEKFCTKTCSRDAECPMYAACKSTKSGNYCVHQKGRCVGQGKQCHPCTTDKDCSSRFDCLRLGLTGEAFCAEECAGTCSAAGYQCYSSLALCIPTTPSNTMYPTCVKSLNFVGQVGDIMEDFEMVGYRDKDGDHDLTDEKLEIIKLSDYKDKKIILLNVSAFW
jgi:hypothetical protein